LAVRRLVKATKRTICIHLTQTIPYHKQTKYTVQHNTAMSYHTALHVSLHIDHHQTLIFTTILKK